MKGSGCSIRSDSGGSRIWIRSGRRTGSRYLPTTKNTTAGPKATKAKPAAGVTPSVRTGKQGLLSAERIARMDAEGFIWTIDDVWMENYEKLQQFFSENNRWPTARENKLGSWCFVQRRALKKGELSSDRKDLLDKISFP